MVVADELGNTVDTPIPAWFLAPYEDKEIRKRCQDQANEECKKQFVKFGLCAQQHQILFSWKCADLKKDVIDCVAHWGAHEKYEDMRALYIEEKKNILREEGKTKS